MQGVQTTTTPKCATLESPKRSYDALLFRISDSFGEKEMEHFEFAFRNELPKRTLDVHKPLKWFSELEQRDMLSLDNLTCIANFLHLVSHNALLEDVYCYQGRRRTVVFFQRSLERKIHGLCLDEKFTQHWKIEQSLPRNFLKRCHNFFREIQSTTFTVNDISCIASRGVNLLVKSCQASSRDLDSIAFKMLYFSNLFFERFHEMILKHRDLLKLKRVPALGSAARCPLPRNNRQEPVDLPPQAEVAYEIERPQIEERPSSDLYLAIKLALFTTVLILLVFPLLVGLMVESESIGFCNKK